MQTRYDCQGAIEWLRGHNCAILNHLPTTTAVTSFTFEQLFSFMNWENTTFQIMFIRTSGSQMSQLIRFSFLWAMLIYKNFWFTNVTVDYLFSLMNYAICLFMLLFLQHSKTQMSHLNGFTSSRWWQNVDILNPEHGQKIGIFGPPTHLLAT